MFAPAAFDVAPPGQVTLPAQDRVVSRSDDQRQAPQRVAWQRREQDGRERPIRGLESRSAGFELSLQHADLVARREDLDVLLAYRSSATTTYCFSDLRHPNPLKPRQIALGFRAVPWVLVCVAIWTVDFYLFLLKC